MSTQPENEQQPSQEAAPAAAAPVGGIGHRLREAREARGLQTSDVAQALKITQRQIEAMEKESFDLLPGAAFVRGFLRNYARFVGLNLDEQIRALTLQDEDTVPARAIYRVPEKGSSGIDWLATATPLHSSARKKGGGLGRLLKVLLLLVLLAVPVAAYFDWFRINHMPGLLNAPQETGEQNEILLPNPQTGEIGLQGDEAGENTAPEPAAISLPTPQAEVIGSETPAADSGAENAQGGESESAPAPDASAAAPQEGAAAEGNEPPLVSLDTAAAAPAGNSKLVFEAGTESWVTVQDSSGRQLLNKRLPRGVPTSVEGKPPFRLTVGNAAKVKMTRDGEPVDLAPHTRSGGVARLTLE